LKYDHVNHLCYDHSPEEWIQVLKTHGPGVAVTGRLASQLVPKDSVQGQENDEGKDSSTDGEQS